MPSTQSTRKRQQRQEDLSLANGDHANKKAKGRPRVDKQDDTAADRRRTQIRLAQRAYRQRKENTINSLQDHVASLQSTIEGMSKEFLSLNEKLLQSSILYQNSDLVREIQKTTERFLLLAKSSEGSQAGDDAESERDFSQFQSRSPQLQSHSNIPSTSVSGNSLVELPLGYVQVLDDESTDYTGTITPPEPINLNQFPNAIAADDIIMGGQQSVHTSLGTDFPAFLSTSVEPISPKSPQHSSGTLSPKSNASDYVSDLPLSKMNPPAPYTYSLDETTFARRLHRAAIEKAYHLLANAPRQSKAFNRAFKLSLLSYSREDIMTKARYVLTKPNTDPLEFFRTPYIHLGGAGLHYSTGRKENAYILIPGPIHNTARLKNADTGRDIGIQFDIDLSEYDGDWFDPNDVEGYLKSLGVYLNPRDTFAEVLLGEDSPLANLLRRNGKFSLPAPTSDLSNPDTTSKSQEYQLTPGAISDATMRLFPELGLGDLNSYGSMVDVNNVNGWLMGGGDRTPEYLASNWSNLELPNVWDPTDVEAKTNAQQFSNILSTITRKATMDVGGFLNNVIKRGICLGRSPGFRKADVERALVNSIIDVV